ncbi:MAG: gliding motility-associated C-terminal domain-containing protein [Flavobacteriales bacterium]|nr:gliding motility-associated C-terminal domain-containing protein [Flavobacteriales bacterium]
MSPHRVPDLRILAVLLLGLLVPALATAQQQRHWVGGSGDWNDRSHWAAVADGPGGASLPRNGDAVYIAPAAGPVSIALGRQVAVGDLHMDGSRAQVALEGVTGGLRVGGDLVLRGSVAWHHAGTVELYPGKPVSYLDLRGIPLGGDLRLTGGGTWSLRSDLVLGEGASVDLLEGTLSTQGSMLRAAGLHIADRGAKLMAGNSVVSLAQAPRTVAGAVEAGTSRLIVAGALVPWGDDPQQERDERAINVCGTGPGQTMFTIDAQLMSNYNGFGVSCHGVCNGSVRVVVAGGVGPFTYSWVGGPATAVWNNVCPGNQIVIVTDQGQGVSCATTVQVTDPALLSVIFFGTTAPTCAGVCNGSSSAFAVGGVPGYNYSWNNGAGTGGSFNQLCPGANTLHVSDANGCAFDTTFNFPIQPIQPNLTTVDVQCSGGCDGEAAVAPVGGSGSFTFDWGPGSPAGDGTNAVTGLCAGNWTVTISDANGCDTTLNFQINQPPPILPNPGHTDASCGGTCDGTATVAPTGGSGSYTYVWVPQPGAGQGTAQATGLCEGIYSVTITDTGTGCDTVVAMVIDAPPTLVPSPSSTDATCSTTCDGTATVAPTGGTPPFTYTWSPAPPAGQGTATASQLCPGIWNVTIGDAAGCDTTVTFTIQAPPPITAVPAQSDVTCAGACDGTASAPATGGSGTLTYDWQPGNPAGDGTASVTGLCAGNWSVLITDANGCDTTLQFTIAEPLPLSIDAGQTDVSCGGTCDGTAAATVSGGTPGYTYNWSPAPPAGQGTANAGGLCAGTWTLTVTDANGCTSIQVYDILPAVPMDVDLQLTPASCAGSCDGEAVSTVTGGTGPYTYQWSPAPGGGQGTPHATGLCEGVGTLTVTDAVGCDTTIQFSITAPPAMEANATVADPLCAGACDGSIVLAPTGGNGTYTYQWTPVPPNGDGTPQATGLCAGTWSVTISSGGCDSTFTFNLQQPPPIDVQLAFTPATCAGACDGTGTVTGTLAGLSFSWSPAPGSGQGTPSAAGFCPGPASVTVTNAAGCDTVINFTITVPDPLVVGTAITDASCGTACDGQVVLTVSGGTPGYTYSWSPEPGTGQGTATAGGLCPGTYAVTIADAAGCDTTLQVSITRPAGITATSVIAQVSCAGLCDGAIQVTAGGGAPPYTWSWSPEPGTGQGTSTAGGLCPGTWTVAIGDQAGCDTSITFNITAPDPIDPHGTFTHESCNGPCDGTATVAPTGGNGTYTYNWSPMPPSGQGTPTVSGLCAGPWCVTVSDGAGCDTTWCFTILPEQSILATVSTVDGLCWDECTGEATATASGGAGGFTFQWTPEPGAGQGTNSVTGLCQGPGTVTITDAAGCDTTIAFNIVKNPPIEPNLVVFPETCAGACTGEAGVYPTGGAGNYSYAWQPDPGTGQGTNEVTGLCSGVNYSVTVTDSAGCDTVVVFTVPAFIPIAPSISVTDASCWDGCDGTATVVSVTGGTPPFTYFWSPVPANGQGGQSATGLCPGTATVTVTDAAGCDTTITFTIQAPAAIDPQPTVTPIACGAQCTGAIDLTPTGGSGGFSYTWTPAPAVGQGTAHVSQLCAGDWTVVITDANGCDTTMTFSITEPVPVAASATVGESHCGVCEGTAQLHPSGGTAPYQFQWGPPLNTTTTDSLMTGLCAGVYTVTVTDAAGCSTVLAVAITDGDGETITTTDGITSCPGVCDGMVTVSFNCTDAPCTIAWTDMAGNSLGAGTDTLAALCQGNYLVAVTNGSGCTTVDTASVTEPAPLVGNISSTPVSCTGACDGTATIGLQGGVGPFTFNWSPAPGGGQGTPHATGLCAGTYQVQVQDLGDCPGTFNVLILAPNPITVDATVTSVSCNSLCDGQISVNAQGGTGTLSYTWAPPPPSGQGTPTATGLCPGNYNLTITDANGCDTTLTFNLVQPQPLVITGSTTPSHCVVCDGTATVNVSGGSGALTVQWSSGGNPVGTGTALTGLCAGVYVATVTDANGCGASLNLVVPDAVAEAITVADGQTLCGNSCDALVSVAYMCNDAPCTVTWTDLGGNVLGVQDTLGNLCTGSYLVMVTNASGCTAIDTAHVTPSQLIVPNLGTTPASCAGACDGIATVGPVGGIPPYTYTWAPEPPGGQSTPQATGLCPGTWQVTIADNSGCDTVVSVLITAPQPLAVNAQLQQVTCAGACDASIVVTPAGGSGPYTFLWSPEPPNGQGTDTADHLCPGSWMVTVADANGCDTTLTFTVQEPAPLTVTATPTNSDCQVCNGTGTAQVSGGTAPYVIVWMQGTSILGTDTAITGLCAGLYRAVVQDANGCLAQAILPLNDVGGEVISASNTLLDCPNSCDGQVYVDYNCAFPPCTVAWFAVNGTNLGVSSDTLSNLCAGFYFAQVTNGAGCITLDTARVVAPPAIQANLGTTPESCAGMCDGTATVAPTGGTGGYTYVWTQGADTIATTAQVTGLCAGNYTVAITDAAGCTLLQGVLILAPDPITATAVASPITCAAACDGSIHIAAQGGTGQLTFQWSPEPGGGQGTHTATGLCAGTWSVTVADLNGCDTTFTINLPDPPALNVDLSHTDNACFDGCAATAHVDITGGTGPYAIVWEDATGAVIDQDVQDVFGLCAGNFQVTVTDSNGCAVLLPFTVSAGEPIEANLTFLGESCNGPCDGTATVAPVGGSGSGYTYLWQPGTPSGQGTDQVTGLCPDNYTVTITDGIGCDTTYAFTIDPFQLIAATATVQQVSCSGACDGVISLAASGGTGSLSFQWSPQPGSGQGTASVSGLCAGSWTVAITDAAGCDTSMTFDITEPAPLTVTTDNVTAASCNSANDGAISVTLSGGTPGYGINWTGPDGYSSADEDISTLFPGNYTLTVTDLNGCQVTTTVTVGVQNNLVANAGLDRMECGGTAITLDGSASQGATTFQWTDAAGTVVGSNATVDLGVLPDGQHSFVLTVANGPCSASDTVQVLIHPLPIADAGDDRSILAQDSTVIGGAPSGPPGSSFFWQPDSLLNDPFAPNPTATPPFTMWFHLTVVSPDGCVDQDSVLVTVVPTLTVPTGFTPNGDGHNDTWILDFATLFPEIEVQVFSRWGEPLFRSVGYATPWDGRYDGKPVPVGTYYYVIELHDERHPEPLTGPLTVIR